MGINLDNGMFSPWMLVQKQRRMQRANHQQMNVMGVSGNQGTRHEVADKSHFQVLKMLRSKECRKGTA